jgi:hypothetical protein
MEARKTMKKTTIGMTVVAIAIVLAAPAWSHTLSVKGAAAVDGNFGLEILMEAGTTNPTYVRDNTPNAETTYRAQFWIDRTGGIFMDNDNETKATRFVAVRGADTGHAGGGSTVTVMRGIFGRLADDNNVAGGRYTFRMGCRLDNGNFRYIGGVVIGSKKWITMEFKAASAPGANDGICRLYNGNTKYLANLQGERTDLDNDLHNIDFIQLGAIGGLTDNPQDPLTAGPLYFDSFESYRATLP